MDTAENVEVVLAWHRAVNSQDADRLLALSSEDIEVVGPRGSGRGRELLREWLGRAGATFDPVKAFARGDTVVVAQHAVWRTPGSTEIAGKADIASSFTVKDGLVARFRRLDSLDEALADAGLTPEDQSDG